MLRSRHLVSHALRCALVVALCALMLPTVAPAAPTSAADAQAQAAQAKAKLDAMQNSLAAGMSTYSGAVNDLTRTRTQIATDARHLADVQASLRAGQKSLDSQAAFLYRTDGAGFVDVLLGASSFDDFAARLSVLQTIARKDAGLVGALKRDRKEAQRIIDELKAREAQQSALVGKVAAQRVSIQGSIDEQQGVLDSLSAQAAALLASQEKAARPAGGDSGSVSGGSVPKPAKTPGASSGSVKLTQATVEGRGGGWWVMASEPTKYRPTGVTFSGQGTIYSVADNGTGTASGRKLNDRELTCAHRTLPFGTRIAVTHGGNRIIVIVTDRGPYTSGRVIDLTPRGASILGLDGVGSVKCEVVQGE